MDNLRNMQLLTIRNKFLPAKYKLDLNISPTKPVFSGTLVLDMIKNSQFHSQSANDSSTILLHSSKLVITLAIVNEKKLKIVYSKESETVALTLEDGKLPDAFQLIISYVGQVTSIKTFQDSTFGLFKTNYLDNVSGKSSNLVFATHNQPFYAKKLLPVIDEVSFKAPITLSITTLNRFRVVSNTKLLSKEPISMTEDAKFTFEETPALPSHLFAFVVGDLEFIETHTSSKLPVRFYAPIGESGSALYALEVAKRVIPVLSDLLKCPFPLPKMDFVALPFLSDHVMENWGLVTFNKLQILRPETDEQTRLQIRRVIAHELVHQWIGNLVSFDEWKYMWLNESFATWLGNFALVKAGLESEKDYFLETIEETEQLMILDETQPISIDRFMSIIPKEHTTKISTEQLFHKEAYDKGLQIFKMIYSAMGPDSFFDALHSFIEKYKYTSIKGIELWTEFIEKSKHDGLMSAIHSWLKYEEYPVLSVDVQDSQEISVKQSGATKYYNLLAVRKIDGDVISSIFFDEESVLTVAPEDFVCANANRMGYFRVHYSPKLFGQMEASVLKNAFTTSDLVTIFTDCLYFIENGENDSLVRDSLVLTCKLLKAMSSSSWIIDFDSLRAGVTVLEKINSVLITRTRYSEFKTYIDDLTISLYDKIGELPSTISPNNYNVSEMAVRNSLLMLNYENGKFQSVAKALFKNLNLGRVFVPKELIPAMFNLYVAQANQKDFKQVLALTKSLDVLAISHTNCSREFFQTCAVESLAFTSNDDLLAKTLNFVMTNIDSKLIELALIGFQYKPNSAAKNKLFDWYLLHYKQWATRSLLKSQWSAQLRLTLENITNMVIELVPARKSELIEKAKQVPTHGFDENLAKYESLLVYKDRIAHAYDHLIQSVM